MKLCTREVFCPQKKYCPAYFNVGVSFQFMRHFLLVLRTNGCYYPSEIATVGSPGAELSSAQASVLFRNVAIRGEQVYFTF